MQRTCGKWSFSIGAACIGIVSLGLCAICRSQVYQLEPALQGGSAKFAERNEEMYDGFLPPLADWDGLERLQQQKITSYRIVGFTELSSPAGVDIRGDDPKVLGVLHQILRSGFVRRPAVSDLSHSGWGVGGGAHLGVIEIQTQQERFLIGVSKIGFFWGIFHGSIHQQFESWGLGMLLDQLLRDETGHHLAQEDLEDLTGERIVKRQQEILSGMKGDAGSATEAPPDK